MKLFYIPIHSDYCDLTMFPTVSFYDAHAHEQIRKDAQAALETIQNSMKLFDKKHALEEQRIVLDSERFTKLRAVNFKPFPPKISREDNRAAWDAFDLKIETRHKQIKEICDAHDANPEVIENLFQLKQINEEIVRAFSEMSNSYQNVVKPMEVTNGLPYLVQFLENEIERDFPHIKSMDVTKV